MSERWRVSISSTSFISSLMLAGTCCRPLKTTLGCVTIEEPQPSSSAAEVFVGTYFLKSYTVRAALLSFFGGKSLATTCTQFTFSHNVLIFFPDKVKVMGVFTSIFQASLLLMVQLLVRQALNSNQLRDN